MVATQIGFAGSPALPAAVAAGSPPFSWASLTHRGLVRRQNEDSVCVVEGKEGGVAAPYMIAVADGLGGHHSGFIASKMALEVVRREFRDWAGGSGGHLLSRAVRQANEELFSASFQRAEFSDMQTTITAVILERGNIAFAHVGDCRLYRLRNGRVQVLTRDHTQAGNLLRLRFISPEQAKQRSGRHQLTRSLGSQPFVQVDVSRQRVVDGDIYLLCSDGVWGNVSEEDISSTLKYCCHPDSACKELLALALKAGGGDNLSAVVFRHS